MKSNDRRSKRFRIASLIIAAFAVALALIIILQDRNKDRTAAVQEESPRNAMVGVASYYDYGDKLTAAHRGLPLGTKVKVTNLQNENSVVVEITGRGPMRKDRIIDVSERAAKELGIEKRGIAKVRVEVVDR